MKKNGINRYYIDLIKRNAVIYTCNTDSWGSVEDNGLRLDFYGTVKNNIIIMCGLNLAYYYGISGDKSVGKLISDMIGII